MSEFKLKSEYKPSGDQPKAIELLTKGLREGQQRSNAFRHYWLWKNIYDSKCNKANELPYFDHGSQ